MISRYRVSLDGVQLDSLDKNILILDVGYSKLNRNIKQFTTANLDGYDVQDTYVDRQSVVVSFELRIYDISKRNEAIQKINQWASSKHLLKTNDRSGQSLTVECEEYAVLGSVRNWLDTLTLVFVTKHNPYWVSNSAKTLSLTGKSAKGTLKMDGNISDALIGVTVTTAEAITSLQLIVGSTKLIFKGLSVAKNKNVVVDYIDGRYLRVLADGKSILNKLQSSSTDNLLAKCGASTSVSVVADGKVTAVFSGKGLWL